MVWTQTGPGVWTDEYDGAEKVFFDMSQAFKTCGREHGSVHIVCQLKLVQEKEMNAEVLMKSLKVAWERLRFEYPALAVFEKEGKKTYRSPNGADFVEVDRWSQRTFWVEETAASAATLVAELHLRELPCLIFLPLSFEIIFHSSHWRIDALGACMLIDRLLDIVSELLSSTKKLKTPQWNLEFQNLSPSLEDACASSTEATPATVATAEQIRRRNFDTAWPSAGLASRGETTTAPGRSQTQAVEFTGMDSGSIVAACKARGISVTAAVHAACAAAVFDRTLDKECTSYSTVVSVNLRKLLPPGSQQHCVCGTYVTGITHTLDRGDNFDTNSRQLTQAYRQHSCPGREATAYMGALRSIYKAHGQAMARVAGQRIMSNVTVSSLGVVDGRFLRGDHGAVKVDRFRLGSAIMTRQPTLYIWTFEGRLTFSVNYNEAYYSVEDIVGLLEDIREQLSRELAIDLCRHV